MGSEFLFINFEYHELCIGARIPRSLFSYLSVLVLMAIHKTVRRIPGGKLPSCGITMETTLHEITKACFAMTSAITNVIHKGLMTRCNTRIAVYLAPSGADQEF